MLKDKREKFAPPPAGLRAGESRGTVMVWLGLTSKQQPWRKCRSNDRYRGGPRKKVTCFSPLRTSQ